MQRLRRQWGGGEVNFKPMLAADLAKVGNDLSKVQYPLLVSPKLDGLRCIIWEGVAYSRNAEPFPNAFLQNWARDYHNLDGELIVGAPVEDGAGTVLGRTMSGIKRVEGEPDFRFHLFDSPQRRYPEFEANFDALCAEFVDSDARIEIVPHIEADGPQNLAMAESFYLERGYEGVMLRAHDGPYKHGRSTLNEGWLIKLKRFIDGEATVFALEEAEENTNEATRDVLGRVKRSSAKAGKVGKGMVGAILVKDPKWGPMRLSPGVMTHAERVAQWKSRTIVGMKVHWRAFGYGIKDTPRFPRFYGLAE